MEAIWLPAVMMLPLFFNKYTHFTFEPDKATLLVTLSLMGVLMWALRFIVGLETARAMLRNIKGSWGLLSVPVVGAVVSILLVSLISALFSLSPSISIHGSYKNNLGLLTLFAGAFLFAAIVTKVRGAEQIQRLVTVLILTSIPVAMYGIIQRQGLDPLPWERMVTVRSSGQLGNPIFFAAYLIMVFPLTVVRTVSSYTKKTESDGFISLSVIRIGLYVLIALMQLLAIFYSQSRGPLLGLLTSSLIMAVLLPLCFSRRWLIKAFLCIALFFGVVLILMSFSEKPLGSTEKDSLSRMTRLIDLNSETAQVRFLLWNASMERLLHTKPIHYATGETDPFHSLRLFIGHGPGTVRSVFESVHPPALAQFEDRRSTPAAAHNESWEMLLQGGVLGFLAYIWFFTSLFYFSLKWFGLIGSSKNRRLYWSLTLCCGVFSAVFISFVMGSAFLGLGLPLGLVLGVLIYLVLNAVFPQRMADPNSHANVPLDEEQTPGVGDLSVSIHSYRFEYRLILIGLFAAVIGHFVEINFGIKTVTTSTYVFVYAALIVVIGRRLSDREMEKSKREAVKSDQLSQESCLPYIVYGGALISMICLSFGFGFLSHAEHVTSWSEVVMKSFSTIGKESGIGGIALLLFVVWMLCAGVLAVEGRSLHPEGSIWTLLGGILLLSFCVGLMCVYSIAQILTHVVSLSINSTEAIVQRVLVFEQLSVVFYACLFFLMLILCCALVLSSKGNSMNQAVVMRYKPVQIILTLGLLAVVIQALYTNLRHVRSEVSFALASSFASQQQWPVAKEIFQRAIQLSPHAFFFHHTMGVWALNHGSGLAEQRDKQSLFEYSKKSLNLALENNPLFAPTLFHLANLHAEWGLFLGDHPETADHLNQSDRYFDQLLKMSPNKVIYWNQRALFNRDVRGDFSRARDDLAQSLSLDSTFHRTHALLGDTHIQSLTRKVNIENTRSLLTLARDSYAKAISQAPKSHRYRFILAGIQLELGAIDEAKVLFQQSIKLAPSNKQWKAYESLSIIHERQGNRAAAVQALKKAAARAPRADANRLNSVLDMLNQ